jgi:hypothetical protein
LIKSMMIAATSGKNMSKAVSINDISLFYSRNFGKILRGPSISDL